MTTHSPQFRSARVVWLVLAMLMMTAVMRAPASPVLAAPSTPAAFPSANGNIAFVNNRDGNSEIYSIGADGLNLTRLTNNPAEDVQPDWSPDGSKIAFVSNRSGNNDIYIMDADGSNLTRLTTNSQPEFFPAWSPDGSKIAFQRGSLLAVDIYTINADGSGGETKLTNAPTDGSAAIHHMEPTWSPDGSKIAFVKENILVRPLVGQIYVMNADGTGQTQLTKGPGTEITAPDWSPDGSKIAFNRSNGTSGRNVIWDLYIMDADGQNETLLVQGDEPSGWFKHPSWAPDGSDKFVMAYEKATLNYASIAVYDVGSRSWTRVLNEQENLRQPDPDWQPLPAGTIRIVKAASPADNTIFTFTDTIAAPNSFTLQNPGTITKTFATVAVGTYTVTEQSLNGWSLENIICDDADSSVNKTVRQAIIRLTAKETVTCTFANSKLGSIKIVKKTQGGEGTFSYSSPQLGNFRLTTQKKEADRLFTGVAPGIYSVSEAPTKGWDLTNAICSNGSNPGRITVALGENVTCSFTNVKRGSITVVKTSVGGDATFGFTSAALGGFDLATVGGTAQRTFDYLVAGTYDLSESALAGWAQTGATCSDFSTLPNVNVAAGEDVTCTFTNTKQGSLTVVKQAQGSDTTFAFTSAALGNFNLTTVNGRASQTFASLNPGAYDLSETMPASWRQTSATCSDGSTLPNVNVDAGEDVTCTFANEQLDTILIVKLALGGDDTFSFTSAALGNFTMTTSSGSAVKAFSGLAPGSYAVAESAAPGWNAAEADPTCSNGNKASNINLASGQLVVCIFVNLKPDTIVVEKRTVGGDGSFGFSSNLPGAGSFTLATANGAASRTFNNLSPATYNISETPQAGWAQTGVSCDNGATPDNINLMPGMTVRCIFTDTKLSNITVVKQATGGDGSFSFTGSLGSFNLTTAGGTAQRTFANLLPGSHRINETTPAWWRQTSAGCADGSNPASLNLSAGKNLTCTFANTKLGSLTVVVDTTGGNGTFGFTSAALGNFDITTTAGTGQKAFANLTPGTYDLTEVAPGGWDLGLATCSNGSNPASVTVAPGENVVCTFENTDARKRLFLPIINKQ